MKSKVQWQVVRYAPKYRQAVLDLMELVQGHPTSPEAFSWWFEQNPTGDVNVCLGLHEGRAIGVSCHNTFRMLYKGQEHIISFPLNALTHPDYRGQGVYSRLERANEEHARQLGVPFMLSFPNAVSTPIFLGRLGWIKIATRRFCFRPLRCDRLAARVPVLKWISPLLKVCNPFFAAHRRIDQLGFSATSEEEFGDWADQIYDANRPTLPTCIARGRTYLTWRFMRDPSNKYRLFAIRDGGEVVGYVVLGKIQKRGVSIGYIANALMLPQYERLSVKVQNSFTGEFRALGVDLILGWPTAGPRGSRGWYNSGFLPLFKRPFFIYKEAAADISKQRFENCGNWFFQLGDLDFF
jgi:GNAT superfamily N-acetyltransferase